MYTRRFLRTSDILIPADGPCPVLEILDERASAALRARTRRRAGEPGLIGRRNSRKERAIDQAGDRSGCEQREPGGEDAGEGVSKGGTAAHVLKGQPVDGVGDGGGEREREGPEARTKRSPPV